MRVGLTGFSFVFLSSLAAIAAGPVAPADRTADLNVTVAKSVLRSATDLALTQGELGTLMMGDVLLQIAEAQTRAGDFEAALKSIHGASFDGDGRRHYRAEVAYEALVHLAESLARDGQLERGLRVLNEWDPAQKQNPDSGKERVSLRWIEHLISVNDLIKARTVTEQLEFKPNCAEAYRQLAVAYARSGDGGRASEFLDLALDAARESEISYGSALVFCEIVQTQLDLKKSDEAKATIRELLQSIDSMRPHDRFSVLLQSAVLMAKAKDELNSRNLFERAGVVPKEFNAVDQCCSLLQICICQMGVGDNDSAQQMISTIDTFVQEHFSQGPVSVVALPVAVTLPQNLNLNGTMQKALSVRTLYLSRDDVLHSTIDFQIAIGRFASALRSSTEIRDPSDKAVALLTLAAAVSSSGDAKSAAAIAEKVQIEHEELNLPKNEPARFDFRHPRSWGVVYGNRTGTAARRHDARLHAAKVAAQSMSVALSLNWKPDESYAVLFNDFVPEVVCAVAREHARSGDARAALAWAREIGSNERLSASGEGKVDRSSIARRIFALAGVAEGILDRMKIAPN